MEKGYSGHKRNLHVFESKSKIFTSLSSIGHLTSAAEFIVEKLKSGSKIAIWGDYDVDGITSTSILVDLLKRKGFLPTYYIPNRLTEGYV